MNRQQLLILCAAVLLIVLELERLKVRNRPRLSAKALVNCRLSPWIMLWNRGDDRDLMHVMGLDRKAFNTLLTPFTALYNKYTMRGKVITSEKCYHGNRVLSAPAVLGVVLHWLCSKAEEKYLCMLFGVTESTFNKYKTYGIFLLLEVTRRLRDCAVRWPSKETQRRCAQLINIKEPMLSGVWGFVDGLNLQIFNPGDIDEQNAYWNGWLHETCCSSLICWRSDGFIAYMATNYPGSWHDSAIAGRGFYQKLDYGCEGQSSVACDSAFPKPATCPHLARVDKSDERLPDGTPEDELKIHQAHQNALIAVRQAAEWGMGLFQATFKRLQWKLTSNPKRRSEILELCMRLSNCRCIHVGLNQIKTVFGSVVRLEKASLDNIYGADPAPPFSQP